MELVTRLDAEIKKVCPIVGFSIGKKSDKSTWKIHFDDVATDAEKAAAEALVEAFDLNAAQDEERAAKDDHDKLKQDLKKLKKADLSDLDKVKDVLVKILKLLAD